MWRQQREQHTQKLWTQLKPAYSRNAEKKKYFSAVYITGMFPCLQAGQSWLFRSAKMETLVSFRCLKVQLM